MLKALGSVALTMAALWLALPLLFRAVDVFPYAVLVASAVALIGALSYARRLLPTRAPPERTELTMMGTGYRDARVIVIETPPPSRPIPSAMAAVFFTLFLAEAVPTISVGLAAARGHFSTGWLALLIASPIAVFLPFAARGVRRGDTACGLVQVAIALLLAWPIVFGLFVVPAGDDRYLNASAMHVATAAFALLCVADAALLVRYLQRSQP